jgi:hypothetical protein
LQHCKLVNEGELGGREEVLARRMRRKFAPDTRPTVHLHRAKLRFVSRSFKTTMSAPSRHTGLTQLCHARPGPSHVWLGSCVTSIAGPNGGAQLYER